MAAQAMADLSLRDVDPGMASQQAEMMSQSVSGETWAAMFEATYEFDVTPMLSQISPPTLVVHRVEDAAQPFRMAQDMATTIPNARLVPVSGSSPRLTSNLESPALCDPPPNAILPCTQKVIDFAKWPQHGHY